MTKKRRYRHGDFSLMLRHGSIGRYKVLGKERTKITRTEIRLYIMYSMIIFFHIRMC